MGMYMCISTMAAAGFGNTISDVLGLGLAHYVERFCEFLGLRPPKLTQEQMELRSSRRVASYVSFHCQRYFQGKKKCLIIRVVHWALWLVACWVCFRYGS